MLDRGRARVAAQEYAGQVQPLLANTASATARFWSAMPDTPEKAALERYATRITGMTASFNVNIVGNISAGREPVNREDRLAVDSALSIVNSFTGAAQRTIHAEIPISVELRGRAQAAAQHLTALKQAISESAIQQNVLAAAMGDDSGNDDPNR